MYQAGTRYFIAVSSRQSGYTYGSIGYGSGTLLISRVTGSCTYPEPLSVGNNVFDEPRMEIPYGYPNTPIAFEATSGITLSYAAGTCGAAAVTSYNVVYFSFTPSITGDYRFSTCETAK